MKKKVIILSTLLILLAIYSCNSKRINKDKDTQNTTIISTTSAKYTDAIKNAIQLRIYCWCFDQNPNIGGCITDMGMSAEDVIKKNQIVFSTNDKKTIDSIIYNMVDENNVIGISKNIGDARIVIKFDNFDSSYNTINFTEHNNSYVILNDTVLMKLGIDPIKFINRMTGLKNIECQAN
jgi:hypothetical protein